MSTELEQQLAAVQSRIEKDQAEANRLREAIDAEARVQKPEAFARWALSLHGTGLNNWCNAIAAEHERIIGIRERRAAEAVTEELTELRLALDAAGVKHELANGDWRITLPEPKPTADPTQTPPADLEAKAKAWAERTVYPVACDKPTRIRIDTLDGYIAWYVDEQTEGLAQRALEGIRDAFVAALVAFTREQLAGRFKIGEHVTGKDFLGNEYTGEITAYHLHTGRWVASDARHADDTKP